MAPCTSGGVAEAVLRSSPRAIQSRPVPRAITTIAMSASSGRSTIAPTPHAAASPKLTRSRRRTRPTTIGDARPCAAASRAPLKAAPQSPMRPPILRITIDTARTPTVSGPSRWANTSQATNSKAWAPVRAVTHAAAPNREVGP